MAALKKLLYVCLALTMVQCRQEVKKMPDPAFPQMSKEEGKKIIEREISVWEFSKTKQLDKLREILADDYTGYFANGIMRPGDVINLLKKISVRYYRLSNIQVKPVTENAAIIYYTAQQDIIGADGSSWLPEIAASSVYAKRNGVWYSVFYQEMPFK